MGELVPFDASKKRNDNKVLSFTLAAVRQLREPEASRTGTGKVALALPTRESLVGYAVQAIIKAELLGNGRQRVYVEDDVARIVQPQDIEGALVAQNEYLAQLKPADQVKAWDQAFSELDALNRDIPY